MSIDFKIGPVQVSNYRAFLIEPSRPPSRGGNTRARHRHAFEVDGEAYSFFAAGSKKWIFASDTADFTWAWDDTKTYRNVVLSSLKTLDKNGVEVVRGDRDYKKMRASPARMPASRREQRG